MTRRLQYLYHMQLNFEQPIHEHHFKLRCFPSTDERQKIFDEHVEIYPVHFSSIEKDSFGNTPLHLAVGSGRIEIVQWLYIFSIKILCLLLYIFFLVF